VADAILKVFPSAAALSQAAADRFVALAQEAVSARGRFSAALSGGSTPQRLYRLLAQPPYAAALPWAQTHLFWGDERLVPPHHPGSNYGQVAQLLLAQVALPTTNVHRIKGELEPAAAVADYTEQLRHFAALDQPWPRLDLALMGMGSDGHTASLFSGPIPAQERRQPVMAVTADYEDRPSHRVTLTPLVFNDAHHLVFLVTGEEKAAALAAVLRGPHQPQAWPAQRIQPHQGTLTWLVDEAAASKLPGYA
jgi:6-phosphogluconolactonase